MSLFSKHLSSIKIPHHKDTAGMASVPVPVPEKVYISMSQNIGRPCQPLVKKGDHVLVGQLIGDSDAPVSAPVYSSASGDVISIETERSALGGVDTYIIIQTDGKQEYVEGLEPPVCQSREDFIAAVRASGVVGLGGASFPTHIKLNPANLDEVDTFIINGAECEPFITSDHRNMLEHTDDIIAGIKLIIQYLDIKHVYVGIEGNKPDAIEAIRRASADIPEVTVKELRSTYPQGAERVLVYEVTGKTLNAGALPASVGCILSNVTTVMVIGQYFRTGIPMVSRNVTIAGSAVTHPGNYIIPLGSKYCDIIEFTGGYRNPPRKIIAGGPMMGKAQSSDGSVTVKNTGSVLFFDEANSWDLDPTPCINCGRCHRACPFGLMPKEYAKAYEAGDAQRLKDLKVLECMNCGSCSYVCPARKPLAFINTLSKTLIKEAGL